MDLAGGLAAVSQALGIAKALKEIDKSFDVATHKARVAELYEALAEVKMALSDAREELHTKDGEIRRLNEEIAALKSGEACPLCGSGRLKVQSIKPHAHFKSVGMQEITVVCDAEGCGHSERRMRDPSGISRIGR